MAAVGELPEDRSLRVEIRHWARRFKVNLKSRARLRPERFISTSFNL
jgi:hypothetical protein